ncbi:uncharacterized protein LOC108471480 [Gossypium arboreum]|uniref:uncharacterized protein LOC108471480 n=1 Tax=Gossypium arboreum TaxID=29729 RepID=UPI0008191301|nr:uncharacterized protein LOC108471480 [Gossypium arboreum]
MTDLRVMFARLSLFEDGSLLVELQFKPVWIEQIKSKQLEDESLGLQFRQIENGNAVDFGLNIEGVLFFKGRICVPKDVELRHTLLREMHSSPYAMHLGGNKMYRDLHEIYWWPGLKHEIIDCARKCLTCQQKWKRVTIDFVIGLPLTPSKKDSVWFIVDRLTKTAQFIPVCTDYSLQKLAKLCHTLSCWIELGERRALGPEFVYDTENKVRLIWDGLKEALDRHKSYADLKRKEIGYSVGDFVFLRSRHGRRC